MVDTIRSLTVRGKDDGLDALASSLRAVKAAQDGLVQSGNALNAASDAVTRRATDAGLAYAALVARTDAAAKAAQNFQREFQVVSRAFDQGKIGLPELNTQLERMKRNLEAAGTAGKSIDQSALNAFLNVRQAQAGAARESAETFEAVRREAEMLDRAMAAQQERMAARFAEASEFESRMRAAAAAAGPTSASAINQRMGIGVGAPSAEDSGRAFEAAFRAESEMIDRAMAQRQAQIERRAAESQAYQTKLTTARGASSNIYADQIDAQMGIGKAPGRSAADAARFFEEQERAAQRSQDALAASANALRAQINPVGQAFDILGQEIKQYNEMLRAGLLTQNEFSRAMEVAQGKFAAIQRTYGGDKTANASKLASTQFTNLGYQANDIISGLAMGQSPMTILTQQGGQVYQALASAQGGVAGGLAAVKAQIGGFVAGLSVGTLALGGISLAALAAALSYNRLASAQREVNITLSTTGRASGVTAAQIDQVARSASVSAGVSTAAARSMATEYAGTGKIGVEMIGRLSEVTKDYATATRQDMAEAQKALAEAFADPTKGAELLGRTLGVLDDATVQNITNLQAQGDRLGAQRLLMEGYSTVIKTAGENVGLLARGWDVVSAAASNGVENVGRGVMYLLKGGVTLEDQLANARQKLQSVQEAHTNGLGQILPDWLKKVSIDEATKNVADLEAQIRKLADASQDAQRAQNSQQVGTATRRLMPDREALRQLTNDYELLKRAAANPVEFNLGEKALQSVNMLLATTSRQMQNLANDIRDFGSAAQAAAMRAAQEESRTVRFSPYSRNVSEINRRAEEEARTARDDERAAIEARRRLQIETETARSRMQDATYSTSVNQVPGQFQADILAQSVRTGVDSSLLASALRQESGNFNPDVVAGRRLSPAGAAGIAQFMPGTAKEYGVDVTDPASGIRGMADYLKKYLDQYDNNVVAALTAYNAGPKWADKLVRGEVGVQGLPRETQDYIAKITTQRPNAEAQAKEVKGTTDALNDYSRAVNDNVKYLDRNNFELDRQTKIREMVAKAQAENRDISKEEMAQIEATATAYAKLNNTMAGLQLSRGLDFQREQLGRDPQEAAIAAQLRSAKIDQGTAEYDRLAAKMREVQELTMARDMTGGALKGIASDLMNGASAADALKNALTRVTQKLMDMAIDNLVANAFKGLLGNGSGSIFSSLFGGPAANSNAASGSIINGVSWSANGNVMTPGGPLPLNRYAMGGVANKAQVSIFGEGRQPEAYVPLPDGRSIPVSMRMAGVPANDTGPVPLQASTVVHNYGGEKVQSQTRMTPQGPRTDIVIGRAIGDFLLSPEAAPVLRKLGVNRAANGR